MLPIGALTLGVPQREGRRMGVLLHSSQRTDVSGRFYIPEHVMNECAAEHVDKDYKHTANQYALVKLIEPRLLRHRQRTTDLTEADAVYGRLLAGTDIDELGRLSAMLAAMQDNLGRN